MVSTSSTAGPEPDLSGGGTGALAVASSSSAIEAAPTANRDMRGRASGAMGVDMCSTIPFAAGGTAGATTNAASPLLQSGRPSLLPVLPSEVRCHAQADA